MRTERTVVATRPRSFRTPLGDTVTVRKVAQEKGWVWLAITLECPPAPLEIIEPGRTWPAEPTRDVWAGCT